MSRSNNDFSKSNQAGKGDKPRNCFSRSFKDNYDEIDWKYRPKSSNLRGRGSGEQQKST